ncbi:TPA: iron-sulfur cluster repair di-iron protein ScdA [Staphylococcus pseudintermedius]|uniref:iron-sulfur cluster repair di-iron protein ScdA n=1 Tax=Staphylococcus pseudintermedius TaxID=283734 RepID=UPI001BDEA8DD|nr:iron-sulfur cluster repair di-iron protein ScdA [Staphylococcus pseudintermedius]EHE7494193.1 iron-sulfur cluster repair di-iron protein ScdA [Staphylococcus pseudintermedius]EJJ6353766.1 iron-sulfur cluster repair di-iron protein ScdA [Staphylococcus pseudintermedius]MDK3917179.1 iron-sulfur cluster repair di-iron protein ScdA [Staphylococcus pseudintermedius]MDK4194142.1 iron-sulfur cluster repair di-iron protein ScdA [Staphylococcus pseudintermedius]HAR6273044.1 iron-sulfur cluster repai
MIATQDKVADIVTHYPKTADVFRKHGIDFCCGGQISLEEAVSNHPKLSLTPLLQELEDASQQQGEGMQPQYLSVPSLIQYIQARYHDTLREEFKQLTPYVTKLSRVHGPNHPNLVTLKSTFDAFKSAMLTHTDEEDQNAFPKLVRSANDETVEDIDAVVQSLVDDHDEAGALLQQMRELTHDFQPPAEACGTWRLVYDRIAHLERETHAHVHLENHVLFPKITG